SNDPNLGNAPIDLVSPPEMHVAANSAAISLWLYRIARNADSLNNAPERAAPNRVSRESLPLDLHYLVTPVTTDPEAKQALLGRVLQVLNDHAILRGADLQDSLNGSSVELRVILESLALEEIARVWDALTEAYQLSVSYMVQVVTIESDLEPVERRPVVLRQIKHTQVQSVT